MTHHLHPNEATSRQRRDPGAGDRIDERELAEVNLL